MKLRPSPITIPEYKLILRHDFASFVEASFRELNPDTAYVPGPHIDLIANKLEACLRGEIKRLIIQLPPRHLKSHIVSVAFPAWALGMSPSLKIIDVSYAQELADKMARDSRSLMQAPWYKKLFPGTRLAARQAIHDFETTATGGRLATSVSGTLTGRGGDIIILDDPLKPADALSETMRSGVNEFFENTALSRLNNKETGCIIIVMQRLHEDDLIGHVLSRGDWEVLRFPAIMEEDVSHTIEGVLGRRTANWKKGQPLHAARESLATLAGIRNDIGEYNFASQYQQRPMPPGGNIIKHDWLKRYELDCLPNRFHRIVQSWDTANKAGELNDYSVCTTWGIVGRTYYLLHVYRGKLNFPDLKRKVAELAGEFCPHTILVEDKASGTQLIQELKENKLNVKAYLPSSKADKEVRLHAHSTAFENGRVLIPTHASWLKDYVAEITGFPGVKFADQVDSTTQFLDFINSAPGPMIITEEMLAKSRIPTKWARKRNLMTPWFFR